MKQGMYTQSTVGGGFHIFPAQIDMGDNLPSKFRVLKYCPTCVQLFNHCIDPDDLTYMPCFEHNPYKYVSLLVTNIS